MGEQHALLPNTPRLSLLRLISVGGDLPRLGELLGAQTCTSAVLAELADPRFTRVVYSLSNRVPFGKDITKTSRSTGRLFSRRTADEY